MKIPYRLEQRERRAPAYGLLLPDNALEALRWAVQFYSLEPSLYRMQNGWLLSTRKPIQQPPAGYIALQEVHQRLFIPIHAQLVPDLLTDEASGLTKFQQVIVLPGPQFQTTSLNSVPWRSLLKIPEIGKDIWSSLPSPVPLSDQLISIEYRPTEAALIEESNNLLKSGGLGKNDPLVDGKLPRAPGSNPLTYVGGAAALGIGKLIGGLGKMLGAKSMAALGAGLINKGVNLAPRLVEGMLGKQEAALRALLRQFQLGHIEEALRRALPIGGESGRGGSIYNSDKLPTHNLIFNLFNLFSSSGVGPSTWLGGSDDTLIRLRVEYQKQASLAEQRGDHRRAAFIYVKLLQDLQSAAAVLARGGLHREAALIYLRIQDELKAAGQFEKAGLFDRAIELYRRNNRYDLSGILLSNLKMPEEALAEFTIGADRLVRDSGNYLEAGKWIEEYTHRTDLALNYYCKGWQLRPLGNPVPCAVQMSKIFCQQRSHEALQTLFDEGLTYFANTTDGKIASTFFNTILKESNTDHRETVPLELQSYLREKSLLHFGGMLRTESLSPVSNAGLPQLLLNGRNWAPGLYSDAEYSFRMAQKKAPKASDPFRHVRQITLPARDTEPTCVTFTDDHRYLFVGFASGEVFRLNLDSGEYCVVSSSFTEQPVALVVCPKGDYVHELRKPLIQGDRYRIVIHSAMGQRFNYVNEIVLQSPDVWLSPYLLQPEIHQRFMVYADGDTMFIRDNLGKAIQHGTEVRPGYWLKLAIPILSNKGELVLLGFDGYRLYTLFATPSHLNVLGTHTIGWSSRYADKEYGIQPLQMFSPTSNKIMLCGVGSNGMVYVTQSDSQRNVFTLVSTGDVTYSAACFVDYETVVATASNGLHWYKVYHDSLRLYRIREMAMGPTHACYSSSHDRMIIVLKKNAVLFLPRS